jgi:hypothetical protein
MIELVCSDENKSGISLRNHCGNVGVFLGNDCKFVRIKTNIFVLNVLPMSRAQWPYWQHGSYAKKQAKQINNCLKTN